MREVDDANHGPAKPFDRDDDEEEKLPMPVDVGRGFVSLAVGESMTFGTEFRFTGEGVDLELGRQYSLCFRGSWVRWWSWGTLEVWALFLFILHLLVFGLWGGTRLIFVDWGPFLPSKLLFLFIFLIIVLFVFLIRRGTGPAGRASVQNTTR